MAGDGIFISQRKNVYKINELSPYLKEVRHWISTHADSGSVIANGSESKEELMGTIENMLTELGNRVMPSGSEHKVEKQNRPFRELITLGQPMSLNEAVDVLANYHNLDRQEIIDKFFGVYKSNLQDITQVIFEPALSGGNKCININVYTAKDSEAGGQLIDPQTGHAFMRVG